MSLRLLHSTDRIVGGIHHKINDNLSGLYDRWPEAKLPEPYPLGSDLLRTTHINLNQIFARLGEAAGVENLESVPSLAYRMKFKDAVNGNFEKLYSRAEEAS